MDRSTIARKATAEALRTRLRAGYGLDTPICAYDLAGCLGIEVRFFDLPSLEGMYYNSPKPHIILSSLRPPGRRAFTCAHELGHHSRGDGSCLDEMVERWTGPRFDSAEFFADCFAGALLMPKTAVERAFLLRQYGIRECTPGQVYAIANYFGVGYSTLVHHLSRSLSLLSNSHAERLLKVSPRRAQAMAVGLAQAGADVAVSDVPSMLEEAATTQNRVEELGRRSATYALDVLDLGNIRAAIDQVVQDFGRLDVLVNNAGIRRRKLALEVTEDDWDTVIDTNLKGVFFCAQAAARPMIDQGGGRIINIASQMAVVAREYRAAYCASKAGVANLTKVLALEWIGYGITVNAIGPGPTTTPGMLASDPRSSLEVEEDLVAHMPLGRRMEPEELVGAAIYLASPSAGATTGHLLIVDGGWTAL